MKTLIALLILSLPLLAEEPEIPGPILAEVDIAAEGGFLVTWTDPERPEVGEQLSIEWSNGQYFCTVTAISGRFILVDYTPTSVVVDLPCLIRLYQPVALLKAKKSGVFPNKLRSRRLGWRLGKE